MNHRISGRKFGRDSSHRKAMFCNLTKSLIYNQSIRTTLPKAKDLRPIVEKLITKARLAKENGKNSEKYVNIYRYLRSFFRNDDRSVNAIIDTAQRFMNRPGGYLRIVKAGHRYGDNAPMAIIQFVDYIPPVKVVKISKDTEAVA